MSDYVKLAQKVVDAYNNKDVDTFIGMYAEGADVVFPDLAIPNRDEMISEFHEIIEARAGLSLNSSTLRALVCPEIHEM